MPYHFGYLTRRASVITLVTVTTVSTPACKEHGDGAAAGAQPAPASQSASAATLAAGPSTASVASAASTAPAPPSSAASTRVTAANDAIEKLGRAFEAHGRSRTCLMMSPEATTKRYVEIEVREDHTPPCAGDPDTAPVVGRFRVASDGSITAYDAVDDAWGSAEKFFAAAPPPAKGAKGATTVRGKTVLTREFSDGGDKHKIVLSLDSPRHRLYAYDFCDKAPSPGAACWKIQDGIDDCDADVTVDFAGDKLYTQEVGASTAAAVLYRIACRSDVSAYTQKLIGYYRGQKFAVRGETGAEDYPAHRTPDVANPEVRTWALATWDKYSIANSSAPSLPDWAGKYEFTETCGRTVGGTGVVVVHRLIVSRAPTGYVADLDSDGYQTMERLHLRGDDTGAGLTLVMDSARSGNTFDAYKKDDVLFSLSANQSNELQTTWTKYTTACSKASPAPYFKKSP